MPLYQPAQPALGPFPAGEGVRLEKTASPKEGIPAAARRLAQQDCVHDAVSELKSAVLGRHGVEISRGSLVVIGQSGDKLESAQTSGPLSMQTEPRTSVSGMRRGRSA